MIHKSMWEAYPDSPEIARRLPRQTCALGYTLDEVELILYWNPRIRESSLAEEFKRFELWMSGQTMAICEGPMPFYTACPKAHGHVVYRHDLIRYLAGLPVVDW